MEINNEFIKYLIQSEANQEHREVSQTIASVSSALMPVIAARCLDVEEREEIFNTWYTAIREKINDEAKEINALYMNMDDSGKKEVSEFYSYLGKEAPDGELIRVMGKGKLDRWIKYARQLLALDQ